MDTKFASRLQQYVLNGGDPIPPANPTSVSDWYNTYAGYIDGIFLDDGPSLYQSTMSESFQQSYYSSLYRQIMGGHSGGCAGHACVMLNASQFPNSWVLSTADEVILWERALSASDGQSYLTNFIPNPAWWSAGTTSVKAEHVIYGATQYDVDSVICKSWARGSPDIYIHDQATAHYSALPSFFEQEVDSIQGCNSPSNSQCGTFGSDSCGNPCPMGTQCPGTQQCRDGGGYQYYVCL